MPSAAALKLLGSVPGLAGFTGRLSRRRFAPLASAPKHQGRLGEFRRLLMRALGQGGEKLAYQANDWLMRAMANDVRRCSATMVHAYEDCSLWQFQAAKRKGLACVYDLPIGYYPVWQEIEARLVRKYEAWRPPEQPVSPFVRPEQKESELALADLVLAPGSFAEKTVREYFPDKRVALAPYGVDAEFWSPGVSDNRTGGNRPLTFIYAGQISLRKGSPDLLEAWERAGLRDARLRLVGSWQLSQERLRGLPKNVEWHPPCSAQELREHYRNADIFIFPSYFEGFGLVLLEAMACGLPAIATDASAMPDLFSGTEGALIPAGDHDALVESLRWASSRRNALSQMGKDARRRAELCTWAAYRKCVQDAVAPLL